MQSAKLFLETNEAPHTDPNKCWANALVGLLHIENKRGQLAPSPGFTEQAECMRPAFPFLNAFATWHQASKKHPFYSILNSNLISEIYVRWGEVMHFLSRPSNEVDHAV